MMGTGGAIRERPVTNSIRHDGLEETIVTDCCFSGQIWMDMMAAWTPSEEILIRNS